MSQVIKVFTPVKRVPTMIGKSQNGQKLPFGPYTLPQVAGGMVLILITSVLAMTLPANPAVTFIAGSAITIAAVFGIGLVPYTGVRLTSRMLWVGRLLLFRKPVSASGMPVTEESARHTLFVEESVVIVLPDRADGSAQDRSPVAAMASAQPLTVLDRWAGASVRVDGEEDGALSGGRR
ncbi:hypothetical protein [Nocardia mexicana]|uniref:Uncharacterized protein n=1 Tax=Nocardia mexicana TaxID=279262 RepID=A0A370HDR4_9NOCA|nr:hypothetical protein [Nocardia mexicana]RDI54565.1 hypothetical protein DFR68_102693 [Nocardia mexicana]